jgi:hypothetical protein
MAFSDKVFFAFEFLTTDEESGEGKEVNRREK